MAASDPGHASKPAPKYELKYELKFRQSVARDLRTVPKKDLDQLPGLMLALADNPRPDSCERLSGQKRYRLRHGECRVVYEVNDASGVVVVVKVSQRRENFSLF
jgi:mRNA interferase RelE/StbE